VLSKGLVSLRFRLEQYARRMAAAAAAAPGAGGQAGVELPEPGSF
jgi:hypothetical protein